MSPTPTAAPSRAAAPPRTADAARSFEACAATVRARARNFYHGLRLCPEPRRSAVYAIYAWMRFGDDLADGDGPLAERAEALAEFRRATDVVLDGGPAPDHGHWPAFAATLRAYPVRRDWIEGMMEGLAEDLDHRGYATLGDLRGYCERVASTVGLTCVSIWGLRPGADADSAETLARRRGVAFQLTNILRDVGEDGGLSPGRVYIPRDVLARHGLSGPALTRWESPLACEALVRELASTAEAEYAASRGLERLVAADCAPVLWTMTAIYRGVLAEVARRPDVAVRGGPARLPSWRKGLIAARAVLARGAAVRPWEVAAGERR